MCEDLVEKTFESHIQKIFIIDSAARRLSKRLIASSAFKAAIATFVKGKMDTAIKQKNCSTTFRSTGQLMLKSSLTTLMNHC